MNDLVNFIGGVGGFIGFVWLICVPLAKVTGNFDDPRGSIGPGEDSDG